jgi:molybdopterin/thiamine biosynthesis adenylyltransferase
MISLPHLLKYAIYRQTQEIMENNNHTDKRMNKLEPHRQTQTITMSIKRTDQLETYG